MFHSLQGITIGFGKAFEYLLFKNWNAMDESRWPNIYYVASSRVMELCKFLFYSKCKCKKINLPVGRYVLN